jgi:hypothetical protein
MMKTLRRYRVTGSVAALFAVILASGILATKWQLIRRKSPGCGRNPRLISPAAG